MKGASDRGAARSAAANELLETLHGPVEPIKLSPKRRKDGDGDFVIAGLGLTLGLVCALFPWYIFFNQEKFGIRALDFDGEADVEITDGRGFWPGGSGAPIAAADVPKLKLDFLPTGTLPSDRESPHPLPVDKQPFPDEIVTYKLVYVANGRAMIQDENGLWVVQPGSRLPDASYVSLIEKRDDGWVIVTSRNKVLRIGG